MSNKSVLVVDTPKSCVECLAYSHPQYCDANYYAHKKPYETAKYGIGIPDWCPLRPLPEKQKLIVTGKNQIEKKKIIESKSLEWIKKGYINNPEVAFYCGYNACLEDITGETE